MPLAGAAPASALPRELASSMSVDELKTVLRETLERRGVLGTLRANLQSEIFSALDSQDDPRPSLTYENMLLNELIREYLEFNQYQHTMSVFLAESGQPAERLRRQYLSQQLQLPPVQTAGDGPNGGREMYEPTAPHAPGTLHTGIVQPSECVCSARAGHCFTRCWRPALAAHSCRRQSSRSSSSPPRGRASNP